MNPSRRLFVQQGVMGGALLLVGCQAPAPSSGEAARAVDTATPAERPTAAPAAAGGPSCKYRLEDIRGALVMYYLGNGRLPERLADLIGIEEVKTEADLVCPDSRQQYTYKSNSTLEMTARAGNRVQTGRIVIYDSRPHEVGGARVRWSVIVNLPQPGSPTFSADVLPVPEDRFAESPP
jgi:hypothetical protein